MFMILMSSGTASLGSPLRRALGRTSPRWTLNHVLRNNSEAFAFYRFWTILVYLNSPFRDIEEDI